MTPLTLLAAVFAIALMPAAVYAEPAQSPLLAKVRVDEKIGALVPKQLALRGPSDEPLRLGDVLASDRPTLLVLAYARCAILCNVLLHGHTQTIANHGAERPGRDYALVIVSIDPKERPEDALERQTVLLERMGYAGERQRLAYLRGSQAAVSRLADAIGFRYGWDERSQQYAHPAVVTVVSPAGRVSGYLHGIGFRPGELPRALTDARAERSLSSRAEDLLRCFRFDPAVRQQQAKIQAYFRIGALTIFLALASLLIGLFVWERRRQS